MDRALASRVRGLDDSPLALRRAHLLAPAVICIVAVLSCVEHPAPGLSGSGLGVTASLLATFAGTSTFLLSEDQRVLTLALASLIAGAGGLAWLQPSGAGGAGMFVAVALAGIRLPARPATAWCLVALIAGLVPGLRAHHSTGTVASNELGIVAFFLVARFGRAAAEAHARAQALLLEVRAQGDAEAEAAMLRERGRLARDMHDVLAHSLSGLLLQLEGARMLSERADTAGELTPVLDRAHRLARDGLDEARRVIAALRDDDLPGPDRLAQLAADFERDAGVTTSVQVTGTVRELDSETALAIYRVAQEALTNIRRHARPDRVEVALGYDQHGTRLTVTDSSGAPELVTPAASVGGGYGLTGMRERAELIGGSLLAEATPSGFRVQLWIPA